MTLSHQRPTVLCPPEHVPTCCVHSGDYGHPFRLKADTVPAESGHALGLVVPVVGVRLSSGRVNRQGHLTG